MIQLHVMLNIKRRSPQSRLLRNYIDDYFFLYSEGNESIQKEDSGYYLYFKKNAITVREKDNILIHSFFTENKISLEIHEYKNENPPEQRNYNGAITEIILKLNKKNTYNNVFHKNYAHELPVFIENFQLLYPNMGKMVDTIFCHRVPYKEKIKYIDEILIQYLTFAQLNGIENILKKNRIKYA